MTNQPATCEVFETEGSNGTFLKAYAPAKFDKRLVNSLKAIRGPYCKKDARGFVWAIAADHICADDFRAAFAAAADRMGSAGSMNGANLTAKMDQKFSDY